MPSAHQQRAAGNQPGVPIAAGRGAEADGGRNLLLLQWNVDSISTSLMDLQDRIRKRPVIGIVLMRLSSCRAYCHIAIISAVIVIRITYYHSSIC